MSKIQSGGVSVHFLIAAIFCLALASGAATLRIDAQSAPSPTPSLGIGANLNGARPFPSNNAWNMDISRFPVHPNSANLIASMGATTGLHPDFGTFWQGAPIGVPYVVVAGAQPPVPVEFIWWPEQSDSGPYPIPSNAPIEGGSASDGDRHVLVIDRDNWKLYETYYSFPVGNGASWTAGSGALWNLRSNKLRPIDWTSADAAGLAIFPGLVRRDEVLAGEIRHAFRFTANTTRTSYVYPATHQAGSTSNVNAPPMGLRVRLRSTFNVNNPSFSGNVRVILRAMQKYGMILADNGSNWYVTGTHDPLWNDDELSVLSLVKGSDFEVVQTPNHLLMPHSDFDGDSRTDVSVFRPSTGVWYLQRSQDGFTAAQFGLSTDQITPADFTGDGRSDIAVWRPSNGVWYVLRSEDSTFYATSFGTNGDIPAPGDYDADGKADLAVYRPNQGIWYLLKSSDGFEATRFGIAEDRPTVGDFDGDGKSDIAVFRPSTGIWYRLNSSTGSFYAAQFGLSDDRIVPADYTGDGKADIAVWRPSNGVWYVLRSENGTYYADAFGSTGDLPTPGDYDGDSRVDLAVYRPATGIWYLQQTYSGFAAMQFGVSEDKPTAGAFVH